MGAYKEFLLHWGFFYIFRKEIILEARIMFGKKKQEGMKEDEWGEEEYPVPASAMAAPAPRAIPMPAASTGLAPATNTAPMFVKVEKYKEIIDSLQEIRNFVNGIKQIFVVVSEIENIRNDAFKMMRVSVQRLEKAAVEIDQELLRPIGFETYPHGEAERGHVEESLTELQDQIAKLRSELEGYSKTQ